MLMSPYKGETAVYRAATARVIKFDVRMNSWCMCAFCFKFASPHFFQKKILKKDKRRRWCAAGQGMVFFFCPKQGKQFRASLAVLNSVHVLCSQNRVIKLKALS